MITFLVAGRNDGYGINLGKRTAISLNFFASLCRDPEDEILYVDCNSPKQDCTLVEAIADTLTPECRRRLKAYRVTGEQMKAAIGETPLFFSDELSRNVGIRRSDPRNPWLLSTNCDILLQPLGRRLLPAGVPVTATRYLGTIHAFMVHDELAGTPAKKGYFRLGAQPGLAKVIESTPDRAEVSVQGGWPRDRIARLAAVVTSLAGEGDRGAAEILEHAARELTALVRAVAMRLDCSEAPACRFW